MCDFHKLEYINCELCGSNKSTLLFHNYDRSHCTKGIFNIVKCNNCGLLYINPRPKRQFIDEYYPDDYEPYNINLNNFYQKLNESLLNSYYKENKSLLNNLKSFLYQLIYSPIPKEYKGRILDIGCGNGIYLYNLKKHGWKVYGVEMSQRAVAFAQKKLKLKNVRHGTIENIRYPDEYFDVITMNHVIEHLFEPKKALEEINRILKKKGLLIITTPNINSFNFKLFREFWFPLETPRHLNIFNSLTMKRLMLGAGFIIKKISYDISGDSLMRSLNYKFKINFKKIKLLFLPFTIILAILGVSDVMTFYIRKK